MNRKICAVLALTLSLAVLAGCSQGEKSGGAAGTADKTLGYQLEMPADGEEIAVMTTSMGEIKIRFFPEGAPKAVENFKALAQKGYYNGVTFHRVINNFMVQGGDPTATGAGGESSFGKNFEDEFNDKLLNLRGSLAMANAGANTNGSQFFINQSGPVNSSMWDQYENMYSQLKQIDKSQWSAVQAQYGYTFLNTDNLTDDYKKLYEENGGNPSLDGAYNAFDPQRGHTVFGQVFEGMDVVDRIAAVSVDSNNKPVSDVTIDSIRFENYQAQ